MSLPYNNDDAAKYARWLQAAQDYAEDFQKRHQIQQAAQRLEERQMGELWLQKVDGDKPVVVCGGAIEQCVDLDAAQARAEAVAHSRGCDAYILKPVRKVAPKRDVVTTDLS